MEKKWVVAIAIIFLIGFGIFWNSYLDPIDTAVREGNVSALMFYATNGTSEEKIAAIEGFGEIKSLDPVKISGSDVKIVQTPEQAQVVDLLISESQNDPNVNVKEAALITLGTVWNDKSISFLKSIEQNSSQIQVSGSNQLSEAKVDQLKQVAKDSVVDIENDKAIAEI